MDPAAGKSIQAEWSELNAWTPAAAVVPASHIVSNGIQVRKARVRTVDDTK